MFSAYMLDPEHGWIGVHRLPRNAAIGYCREYRNRNAGALVALVPDGQDPEPYFQVAHGEPPIFNTFTWREIVGCSARDLA